MWGGARVCVGGGVKRGAQAQQPVLDRPDLNRGRCPARQPRKASMHGVIDVD